MTTTYVPISRDRDAYERTLGLTLNEASILLGCSITTVFHLRKNFEQSQVAELPSQGQIHLPKALTDQKQDFDATPWFDLIQTAAAAFDTDSTYAIAIAEDHRALQNGWRIRGRGDERCHSCASKAVSLSGHCQKHNMMKNKK